MLLCHASLICGPLVVLAAGSCYAATAELVPAGAADFRWRDIDANLYAESYRDSYTYYDASVIISFDTCLDSAYAGHLSASDLKPNFAYQMKLIGKPEAIWGEAGDDLSNERIGYAGRWWRVTPNPGNSNDADYEAHKDDPDYIYEGYLVFDFLITDSLGRADLDFASLSSYHVLWWEDQRTGHPCDSPVRWSTVVGHASDPAYDIEVGPIDVGVYGEIERLCYGGTTLPDGQYNCRFALTEESFHQSGEWEGLWATVLVCDTLSFETGCLAGLDHESAGCSTVTGHVRPNPFSHETVFEFDHTSAGQFVVEIFDVRGRLIRRLAAGGPARGLPQVTWDGRDREGRRVAAGTYFYCLKPGGNPGGSGKVVLTD
jgi:hypothetical protein